MKVVIEIDEETYQGIKDGFYDGNTRKMAIAVGNGKVLPKGHGKIVDASEVVKAYAFEKKTNALNGDDDAFIEAINHVSTIIEAESEE